MRIAVCRLEGISGHKAGRKLLDMLYREETGQPMPEIRRAEQGKPYFPGSDLHFSISHTRRHAVCVLAHSSVGVDAEELDRPLRLKVADRMLSASELQQMKAAEDPRRAFLSFWVLKEALVKLTGEGLAGFPNWTEFTLPDARIREYDGCLIALMCEGEPEGEIFYAV